MLQSLLFRMKFKLGYINPFQIQQQFQFLTLLNGEPSQKECTLHSKQQLNSSTYLMRFTIPQKQQCLGTQIGQYISLNDPEFNPETTRYYCPISRIDDLGMFDLLVHAIQADNLNFSTHLTTLKEGKSLKLGGPFTNYIYNGYGKFDIPDAEITQSKKFRYIGIVAEASAIAAFFQLIEGIATNGDDTHIGLLYVADTMEDLVLMEELQWLMEEKKINVTFMLRNEKEPLNKLFSGPKGEIKPIHLQEFLPPQCDDTLILVCGCRAFKKQIKEQLRQIHHQIFAII